MGLISDWVTYGPNQRFRGYLSMYDRTGAAPAILVIQEFWGVDNYLRDVTERFAKAGYIAFAPDLYSEDGKRIIDLSEERILEAKQFLDTIPPTTWTDKEARSSLMQFPLEKREQVNETLDRLFDWPNQTQIHLENALEALRYLRNEQPQTIGQPIGSIGFCMGGGISGLLACRDPELKGAVVFYGNMPPEQLVPQINCPVLGFFGELDKPFTEPVADFAQVMNRLQKSFEYHIYEQVKHAFFNETRPMYNAAASRDAFARTLSFFNQTLN